MGSGLPGGGAVGPEDLSSIYPEIEQFQSRQRFTLEERLQHVVELLKIVFLWLRKRE